MVALANDASTEIERRVRAFCSDLNNRIPLLTVPPGTPDLRVIRCRIAPFNAGSAVRTPRQQAEFVSSNRSWVCWGAHMSDRARHVRLTSHGRYVADPRALFGAHFPLFTRLWGNLMRLHGLRNFRSGHGWGEGDGYHLELPGARIGRSDVRAQACLEEYVRITRLEGRPRNQRFERSYRDALAPHLERVLPAQRMTPNPPPVSGPGQRLL